MRVKAGGRGFFDRLACGGLFTTVFLLGSAHAAAQSGARAMDDADRVVLAGNVHPLARPEFDIGPTDPTLLMERVIMPLVITPEKRAVLDRLLSDQQDPSSPSYHGWLTPEQFAERFGPPPERVEAVIDWLQSHGFVIDGVARSRLWIDFTGSVADIERAFHTEIRDLSVDGEFHHANVTDPSIPRELADVIAGIASLHDFRSKPLITNENGSHNLTPADFATIYDVTPLYNVGIDGTGASIATVARSNIDPATVENFRSLFGLPPSSLLIDVNGPDPGQVSGEEGEAELDVELAGAVAKGSLIRIVVSGSTSASDGALLSAKYIVDNNLSDVVSMSFGACESSSGSMNSFINTLWSAAASQGMTVVVSSGDAGAAGCNSQTDSVGRGQGVNADCSTPYSTCVGGSQFMDTSNPDLYWAPTNDPTTLGSALSYIPEQAWNESGTAGSGLWATGGGVSTIYAKPPWQIARGVPSDGKRDVPDVALSAAFHDSYLYATGPSGFADVGTNGGTSASAPSFAGIMALVAQKTGGRQGNANPRLYQLGNAQYNGTGPSVFHDITVGNNSVPGVNGFSATTGYDLATGLGSVDAAALAYNWAPNASPDFWISASSPRITVAPGLSGATTVTIHTVGGFDSAITFTASGDAYGSTASFSPTSIVAPGSGSSTLTLAAAGSMLTGHYTVTITASGGATTHTVTITFVVGTSADSSFPFVQQGDKLTGPSTASRGFGASVAISEDGNTAIVGAPGGGGGNGYVRIFRRFPSALSGQWELDGFFFGAPGFGGSVGLSEDGNFAIVGSPGENNSSGVVRVYKRASGIWSLDGTLTASNAVGPSAQGVSVAIVGRSSAGALATVGAPNDTQGAGAVFEFARLPDSVGGQWQQNLPVNLTSFVKFTPPDETGTAFCGKAVDRKTERMVGGNADNGNAGAAWIWGWNDDTYQSLKLVGGGAIGGAIQGTAVAYRNRWDEATGSYEPMAMSGGPWDNNGTGAVWIFSGPTSPGATLPTFTNEEKLVLSGSPQPAFQGTSLGVSWDGYLAVIGAPGTSPSGASIVVAQSAGQWVQRDTLLGTGAAGGSNQWGEGAGYSVDMSADGNTIIVGAPGDSNGAGAAWIFQRTSLKPSFTFSPSRPMAGQPVQFTDTSTGFPISWLWGFDEDFASSSGQDPSHSFATAGTYTVTLTIFDGHASLSASEQITVTDAPPPPSKTVTVNVDGRSGPWQVSSGPVDYINRGFPYGSDDERAPTVVSAGLDFTPGNKLTITYRSGTVNCASGLPSTDANGDTAIQANGNTGSSGKVFPSKYMDPATYPINLGELVGTFADDFGNIVGTPFKLGDGPTSVKVPNGATQLQLGVVDDIYDDNTGSFSVSVAQALACKPGAKCVIEVPSPNPIPVNGR